MAQQCQAPIVPVVIYMPPTVYDSKRWLFGSGVIRIKVLEPIQTTGLTPADITALTDSVQEKMQTALDQMSKRL